MPIFAVHYTYAPANAAGRDEHRPAHREWLHGLVETGAVLSSGAYPDGSGALILFSQPDLAAAEKLLTEDPFRRADVVDGVRVVQWQPTMGAFSE
jgi:uncharacterized protein